MSKMGERIRQKRKENGLTLEELAEKLGVKKSAVSKWERGAVENIKRNTIEQMCVIFDCSPQWLMCWDTDQDQLKADYVATQAAFNNISETDKALVEVLSSMSEETKQNILSYARFMAQND